MQGWSKIFRQQVSPSQNSNSLNYNMCWDRVEWLRHGFPYSSFLRGSSPWDPDVRLLFQQALSSASISNLHPPASPSAEIVLPVHNIAELSVMINDVPFFKFPFCSVLDIGRLGCVFWVDKLLWQVTENLCMWQRRRTPCGRICLCCSHYATWFLAKAFIFSWTKSQLLIWLLGFVLVFLNYFWVWCEIGTSALKESLVSNFVRGQSRTGPWLSCTSPFTKRSSSHTRLVLSSGSLEVLRSKAGFGFLMLFGKGDCIKHLGGIYNVCNQAALEMKIVLFFLWKVACLWQLRGALPVSYHLCAFLCFKGAVK